MISKYNRYNIILICLLCNSIIAISEEQSLIDKPIVDNIPLNNSIGSTKKSIKISKKSKALKRKKKKLRKTALRKSLKSNKNKTVNNKSKVSPGLTKGAKICLGAIGVGGVGWVIYKISKPDKSVSFKKETISSQSAQEPLSGLNKSSETQLEQKQYYSLDELPNLKDLFNKLKTEKIFYTIKEKELDIINKHFPTLTIDDKIKLIVDCWNFNAFYENISFDIKLEFYLISFIEQNGINKLLEIIKTYLSSNDNRFYRTLIYSNLKLWDIILEHSQKQEKQELFYMLWCGTVYLITSKIEEIKQIVNHMISQKKYNDLLIFLLIFDRNYYEISHKQRTNNRLSDYLLSNLQPQDKTQLLSKIEKLSNEELDRYNLSALDINTIKKFLQS